MKKHTKFFALVMVVLALVTTAVSLKDIVAVTYNDYKTTIIDSEGLGIEVANIHSDEIVDIEEYIKANVNEAYAKSEMLVAKDMMVVKNLIAEESKFVTEKTIDAMWKDSNDAFIMFNDTYALLYDTDENSQYYVAYVDNMHDDPSSVVTDTSFAYTNIYGEVITDAIYDYETGLAYVPKKYTEENKNGAGALNVQVELLQVVNTDKPTNSFNVIVEKDENIPGKVAPSGSLTVETVVTEFGINIALDNKAKQNIIGNHFKVIVNGTETQKWEYYEAEGILVIEETPSVINTIEISISEENIEANIDRVMNGGISTHADFEDKMDEFTGAGVEWLVDQIPTAGQLIKIKGGRYEELIDIYYDAWDHDNPSGGNEIAGYPIYADGTTDDDWEQLTAKIYNGQAINVNKLAANNKWLQHWVTFEKDIEVQGIHIPASTFLLKCVHNATVYQSSTQRYQDADGVWRDHAWEIWIRIYEVSDDYLLVGMLTPKLHSQAGAGLFKIRYTTGKGNLEVAKIDSYGDYVAGATFRITGPNGYSRDVVTEAGKKTLIEDLEKGEYKVTEIAAPTNMIINTTTVDVTVKSNETALATITNAYQRGSTRLVKYDAHNPNATKGDAKIGGAEFSLCAAEDIYEGSHLVYTADQVIKSGIVTADDGTTEPVTNLPIGKYYYIETKASEGFNINDARVNVEVKYAGQEHTVAAEGYNTVPEVPVYGHLYITKKLSETDLDPEILLSSVQFELTLKSDPNQKYKTNISGPDGVCEAKNIPYGLYTCKEILVNDKAYPVADFDVNFTENGKTYYYEKVDPSKEMQIEIDKDMLLAAGEKTDAELSGAIFTVYTDSAAKVPFKDKNGKTVVIGPTDKDGYAISEMMRTGTYYLKETTFPKGIDPDATVPGENVTYRNKIYTVTYNNKTQGAEPVKVTLKVNNEPKRNDIEIIKKIGATSNTSIAPLDKCEFTATLISSKGTSNVFSRKCTAETDVNGYCIIEDLPYGEYEVEETKVSPISLKCPNFTVNVTEDSKIKKDPYSKTIVDEPKVMQIKIRKVDANRTDADAPDYMQGDATLEGAIYQIFRYDPQTDDYTEAVYEITVDHKDADGYWCAESDDLLVGKYMVKEKISYTEVVDGKTYNYSYAEGYLADPETYYFDQRPDLQTVKRTYHYDTSKEEVIRGSVEVIKYDNDLGETDETAAEGAILRLTLNSDPNKYYDVTINENGYGEFVEEESRDKYYPYTIPYGDYTITEIKESNRKEHTSFFIQPEPVTISKQVQKEYRIEADEPVEMYLQIQKTDKDTGADVKLAGARFKVWDCQKDEWVSQITYPSGDYIDEFETGEDGNLTLPHKLEAGNYIVYETKAPNGYYLEDEWRIPENAADIGNADKGGKLVKINKAAMNVVENTPANKIDLYYGVDMPNRPLTGRLEVYKTGEMLTEASINPTEFGDKYTPIYELRGLPNVTYDIKAAEDIKSPDGNVTYVAKGTKVDTITTGQDGYARTKELYLGEYEIIEVSAPEGILLNENIENVTLENENTLVRVEITNKEYTNIRQKLSLSFHKDYEEVQYVTEEGKERYSIFGVYANQDIRTVEGNIVIRENDLLDIIKIEGDEYSATSTIDLPEGKYYVQELKTSYPYAVSKEIEEVELKYSGNEYEYITFEAGDFSNTYDSATITLIKISSASLQNVILNGENLEVKDIDTQIKNMINDIKGMTENEIRNYLENKNIDYVAGAEYSIFVDEDCTKPLLEKDENGEYVQAKLVTNSTGVIKIEGLPIGEYYLKETYAPVGYEISEEVIKITLSHNDKDSTVYNALVDEMTIGEPISKLDIFTGEPIANCIFEIKDAEGNVLMHSITNEEGEGYIPIALFKLGETYTYTEIEAPDIYDLNTEPHEFVAEYGVNPETNKLEWTGEKIVVENRRKTIEQLIVRKVDDETGEPLQGCKFSIVLLDENGEPFINKDGEMVYLVKEAVTGENGEYVVEKPYYGSYQFIEVEAPEGYELKVDMEGMEFTIDENSPETVIFEVTNTGDIAVYALCTMAVISVLGIAYVVVKNKKQLVK